MDMQKILAYSTALVIWLYLFQVQSQCSLPYTADRSGEWARMKSELCGTQDAMHSLLFGSPELYEEVRWWSKWRFFPTQPGGVLGLDLLHGWSQIYVPGEFII